MYPIRSQSMIAHGHSIAGQPEVKRLKSLNHGLAAVACAHAPPSRVPQLARPGGILQETANRACKCRLIARTNQDAMMTILDQSWVAPDRRGDDRPPGCHVFEHGIGHALRTGAQNRNVGLSEK